MNVLYIGGTGEISYSCVLRSVEIGHDVTVFNRGRNAEPLPNAVRQITGDLKDAAAYAALGAEEFDVVCQFLAFDADQLRRDLDVFGDHCKQYVFISSTSAYRKPPTSWVMTEDVPLENPFWDYSRRKAQMERELLDAHQAGRICATIVRPSHTYRRNFPGVIGRGDDWAWRILHDRPIVLHGDGTSLWTYTHSDDFAVPFANLLGNPKAYGEAFHITRPMEAHSWNEIFTAVARALGKEPDIVHVPTDTLVRYNPDWAGPLWGDKSWSTVFDNTKVRTVAGDFTPTVALADGLSGVAEHFRRREAAFQPDPQFHDLLDRIIAEQNALGQS